MVSVNVVLIVATFVALVPSTIVGLVVWRFQRKILLNDAERERKAEEARQERRRQDNARKQHETLIVAGLNATMALCEALAIATERGKPNGEVKAALAYEQSVKHEHKDFIRVQGIENLHK